jgi:hypothetical protein
VGRISGQYRGVNIRAIVGRISGQSWEQSWGEYRGNHGSNRGGISWGQYRGNHGGNRGENFRVNHGGRVNIRGAISGAIVGEMSCGEYPGREYPRQSWGKYPGNIVECRGGECR